MLCRCSFLLYVLYLPDFIGCCQSYWFWPHYSLWRHLFERSEQSSCVQCVWEETTRYWHDLRCLRWNQLQVVWVCNRSRPHPLAPSICVTTHVTPGQQLLWAVQQSIEQIHSLFGREWKSQFDCIDGLCIINCVFLQHRLSVLESGRIDRYYALKSP